MDDNFEKIYELKKLQSELAYRLVELKEQHKKRYLVAMSFYILAAAFAVAAGLILSNLHHPLKTVIPLHNTVMLYKLIPALASSFIAAILSFYVTILRERQFQKKILNKQFIVKKLIHSVINIFVTLASKKIVVDIFKLIISGVISGVIVGEILKFF